MRHLPTILAFMAFLVAAEGYIRAITHEPPPLLIDSALEHKADLVCTPVPSPPIIARRKTGGIT